VHLGNVKLHIVSDGVTWSDGGGPFGLWCPFDHESQVPMGYLREVSGKFKLEPT
jgi:hypothetical protein